MKICCIIRTAGLETRANGQDGRFAEPGPIGPAIYGHAPDPGATARNGRSLDEAPHRKATRLLLGGWWCTMWKASLACDV
jgi:hypothetical protein